jgi:hypothetical protein
VFVLSVVERGQARELAAHGLRLGVELGVGLEPVDRFVGFVLELLGSRPEGRPGDILSTLKTAIASGASHCLR